MPEQSTQPNSLYSQNVKTKSNTYFFDVKEAKNGNKYLSITETRIKDGQKFRSSITLFPDNFKEFSETLVQVQEKAQ